MRRIGVFGRRKDGHVRAVAAALKGAGAEPVVVDFQGFPRFNLATMGSACTFDSVLAPGQIGLDGLDLVFLRNFCFSQFEDAEKAAALDVARFHREQIARVAFQHSLALRLARKVPVVNPPHAFRFHRQKARQHELLRRHEIPLPRTLVTSDPSRARAFVDALDQRVVAKPLSGGAEVVMADFAFLSAQADRLRTRPFIFQQYVKGRAFRAYVLGGQIVSFGEIHYDRRHVDWRERTQGVTLCRPDESLGKQIRRAACLLDLPFCGIDVEWDEATNCFYLLDFNPSPLFLHWSRVTGVDVAERISAYLLDVLKRCGDPWTERP